MNQFILILVLLPTLLFSQKSRTHEIALDVDNDSFGFIDDEDRYYSSGILFSYRNSIKPTSRVYNLLNKKERTDHITWGLHFSQLIFTSDMLSNISPDSMDRPFAGIHTLGLSLDVYKKNDWIITNRLDIGILGPSSRLDDIHTYWHEKLDLITPNGWVAQISNTPYINLKTETLKAYKLTNNIDITYEGIYQGGTVFNTIKQGGTLRIGKINSIHKSGYKNGILGNNLAGKKTIERYFFIGPAVEYVFYNSTIQGGFIGPESIFTDTKKDWVLHTKLGFSAHWEKISLNYSLFLNSSENERAKMHIYGRFGAALRF